MSRLDTHQEELTISFLWFALGPRWNLRFVDLIMMYPKRKTAWFYPKYWVIKFHMYDFPK
jgi:hypothetical protein